MRKRETRTLRLLLAAIALVAAVGCGSMRPAQKSATVSKENAGKKGGKTPQTPNLPYDVSRRYDYFFLEAVRQQNTGHYAAAFDLLRHCHELNPQAAETCYMLALYHADLSDDSLALHYLEQAATLNPDNTTYQERAAQYYINLGNYEQAVKTYEALYSRHHHRTDVLNVLLQLYQQQKDYPQMLATLGRIETADGASEETAIAKMRVYELMGNKDMAYQTLRQLADDNPNEVNYRVMTGNWLLQNDRKDEAYKIFTAALTEEPDNAYAQESLYDYYVEVGQNEQANELRDRILTSRRTDNKTKLTMLQQVIRNNELQGGDSTEVLALFDRIVEANPNDADIVTMKAAYMDLKKMPREQINQTFMQVLDIAPDNAGARIELLQALWPEQRWQEIVDLCKPAVEYNPDEMAFYYFMGLAYYQLGEQELALDAFRRGVSQINAQSNPEFVSDFYAIMGDILHQKGKDTEAYAAYDSCLQWKDDNISCLNNYAYYLSVEGRDLERAERMSYKTIKAEPANPTYLDTYAWILFMQKRYDEARTFIDQAVACDTDSTQSAVIIEHAGDIHFMTGSMAQALRYWQQALDLSDDDEAKALLRRKIRLKKYIRK